MNSSLLKDYRCSCGKLLLKGFLFQCVVEIKCKRCGTLTVLGLGDTVACAILESNPEEEVTYAYGDTASVLGYEQDRMIGKSIYDVFPMIRDKIMNVSRIATGSYELSDTTLILQEGKTRSVGSCVLPRIKDGSFAGYRIFSVPKYRGAP